jgi:hypothetical protein
MESPPKERDQIVSGGFQDQPNDMNTVTQKVPRMLSYHEFRMEIIAVAVPCKL